MSRRYRPKSSIWVTALKVIIFLAALYVAYLLLKPLLSVLLGISFWIIKAVVFIAVAVLVIHLFLRIIFGIDLFRNLGLRNRWK